MCKGPREQKNLFWVAFVPQAFHKAANRANRAKRANRDLFFFPLRFSFFLVVDMFVAAIYIKHPAKIYPSCLFTQKPHKYDVLY